MLHQDKARTKCAAPPPVNAFQPVAILLPKAGDILCYSSSGNGLLCFSVDMLICNETNQLTVISSLRTSHRSLTGMLTVSSLSKFEMLTQPIWIQCHMNCNGTLGREILE